MNRKTASMLSISRKAGKLAAGEAACEKALSGGSARLVITASDASDNTKKKFSQKAFYYNVPYVSAFNKDETGKATGLGGVATLAVTDGGLAEKIIELLKEEGFWDIWQK